MTDKRTKRIRTKLKKSIEKMISHELKNNK